MRGDDLRHLSQRLLACARELAPLGLSSGTSGNLSARVDEARFLITPSAAAYAALGPDDLVLLDLEGRAIGGTRTPSSEWRMHADLYRARPELSGIVHAHPAHATALACARRGIPALHYEIASFGGADIRCSDYATFGTQALSRAVLAAMHGRRGCLLANHGMLTAAESVEEALSLAVELENLAALVVRVASLGGGVVLDDAEIERVRLRFERYVRGERLEEP
jgi:L-fuculose-phosphate aldolase